MMKHHFSAFQNIAMTVKASEGDEDDKLPREIGDVPDGVPAPVMNRLFNSMKAKYRLKNIFSFSELLPILNEASRLVQVHKVNNKDHFRDWKVYLDEFYNYNKIPSLKQSHIFQVDTSCITTSVIAVTCPL